MAERPTGPTLRDVILAQRAKIEDLQQQLDAAKQEVENVRAEFYLRTADFMRGWGLQENAQDSGNSKNTEFQDYMASFFLNFKPSLNHTGNCVCVRCLSTPTSPLNQVQQLFETTSASSESPEHLSESMLSMTDGNCNNLSAADEEHMMNSACGDGNDLNSTGCDGNDLNSAGGDGNDLNSAGGDGNDLNSAGGQGKDLNSASGDRNDLNSTGSDGNDLNVTGGDSNILNSATDGHKSSMQTAASAEPTVLMSAPAVNKPPTPGRAAAFWRKAGDGRKAANQNGNKVKDIKRISNSKSGGKQPKSDEFILSDGSSDSEDEPFQGFQDNVIKKLQLRKSGSVVARKNKTGLKQLERGQRTKKAEAGSSLKCSICTSGFMYKNSTQLQRHRSMIHGIGTNLPMKIECSRCGLKVSRNNIKPHMNSKKCKQFAK